MDYLVQDLRSEIQGGDAALWLGVGVSLALSGNDAIAGWQGFLAYAMERCRDLGLLDAAAERRYLQRIGSMAGVLDAGEAIERLLRQNGEWEVFLRDFRNRLAVRNGALAHALSNLDLPIFTVAYDDLVEQATHLGSTTWAHPEQVERVIRRQSTNLVHVHGIWNQPDTIVLGRGSYRRYLCHERAQATLRALRLLRSQVFLGFGAGLGDPHFERLRRWARRLGPSSAFRHYRLCTEKEAESLRSEHGRDRLFLVVYGRRFSDLPGFLRQLFPASSRTPAQSKWRWVAAVAATTLMAAQQPGARMPSSEAFVDGSVVLGGTPAAWVQVGLPGYASPLTADGLGRFTARVEAGREVAVWIQHGSRPVLFHADLPPGARRASWRFHLESGASELAGWR
jgi:hypothetical protein